MFSEFLVALDFCKVGKEGEVRQFQGRRRRLFLAPTATNLGGSHFLQRKQAGRGQRQYSYGCWAKDGKTDCLLFWKDDETKGKGSTAGLKI
jgi:hypothetical protein